MRDVLIPTLSLAAPQFLRADAVMQALAPEPDNYLVYMAELVLAANASAVAAIRRCTAAEHLSARTSNASCACHLSSGVGRTLGSWLGV